MDWNLDGKLDLLSGCYWTGGANAGHIYLSLGRGGLDFRKPKPLKNEDDKHLENISISKDEYENGKGQDQVTEAICTQQHAVDFDGDGDLDLVNGCFGPSFYYYENKGSSEKPSLCAKPIKMDIESTSYHAAPHLVDWDKDGDLDLLSGSADGGVLLSINKGNVKEPRWSKFRQLVPKSDKHEQVLIDSTEIEPGPSTRVWAYDLNGDGWLDLVVGDSTSVVKPADGLSLDDFKQKEEDFLNAVAEGSEKYAKIAERYQKAREELEDDEEIDKKLQKKYDDAREAFMDLRNSRDEWCESKMTGHVWVYIRKPPEQPTSSSTSGSASNR